MAERGALGVLRAGELQVTSLNPLTIFAAENAGFKILADVSVLPFQNAAPVADEKIHQEIPISCAAIEVIGRSGADDVKRDRKTGLRVFTELMVGFG